MGEGSEFCGVVDLISKKAYLGEAATMADIPANLVDDVEAARTQLIEAAAEGDDELIMKYLDGVDLTNEEISRGLRAGIVSGAIVPVFCGSATNNVAVRTLMDALIAFMPSPANRPRGLPRARTAKRSNCLRLPRPADRVRVEDGCRCLRWQDLLLPGDFRHLPWDTRVYSMPSANEERISQIFVPRGKEQLPVTELAVAISAAWPS